jgi:hypothetical protein
MAMKIPWKTIQSWQDEMAVSRLRGCLLCLQEALQQQYLPDAAARFSFSEFTFTCPRHGFATFPAREFMIRFAEMLDVPVILPPDCPDPARELQRIFLALQRYFESGTHYRVERARIPRRR